ncbi:MAG TPA: c-type cytochrome [Terriglobales bacterium]|nr:c-type cytochrome [Terriglobales bacterium]
MRRKILIVLAAVTIALLATGALLAAAPSGAPPNIARAQQAFLAYCAMCHGPKGAGDGDVALALRRSNIVVPALDNAQRLQSLGRARILQIILQGGAHVGRSNVMPEWRGLVGEGLANDLADYVLTLPKASPASRSEALSRYLQAPAGVPQEGRRLYVYHCSACHGSLGRGDGPTGEMIRRKHGVRPRDLTDAKFMRKKTDRDLYAVVENGGAHAGRSVYMPPWKNVLSPAQIKDLVAYLRQLSGTRPQP